MFYRNPFNLDENLFVNITSPSSSKYVAQPTLDYGCHAAHAGIQGCKTLAALKLLPHGSGRSFWKSSCPLAWVYAARQR